MSMKSTAVKKCGNCDEKEALYQCTSCEADNSYFCEECWKVHVKVKQFRAHTYFEISPKIICCNCDQVNASTKCLQCNVLDSHFCEDCSLIHKQVKAFRSHTIVPLNSRSHMPPHKSSSTKTTTKVEPLEISVSEDPATSAMDYCFGLFLRAVDFLKIDVGDNSKRGDKYFDWIIESLGDITSSGDMDHKTIMFGLTVAFLVHVVVKLLLGNNSIFVMIAVGMFGVRWLRRKQYITVTEIDALKSENSQIFDQVKSSKLQGLPQDFKDIDDAQEFWHSNGSREGSGSEELKIGAPQFKPRGPLYKRRGGHATKAAEVK